MTYQNALKVIQDWDGRDETLPEMLGRVRTLAAEFTDPVERGMLERELFERTGIRARILALPKVRASVEPAKCSHCGK